MECLTCTSNLWKLDCGTYNTLVCRVYSFLPYAGSFVESRPTNAQFYTNTPILSCQTFKLVFLLQILQGSVRSEVLTYIPLDPELEARAIRITPKEFEVDIDLKIEIYGEPLGTVGFLVYVIFNITVSNLSRKHLVRSVAQFYCLC